MTFINMIFLFHYFSKPIEIRPKILRLKVRLIFFAFLFFKVIVKLVKRKKLSDLVLICTRGK